MTRKWARQSVYGGLLVENITQAVARDIMAEAMLRCAESGVYDPILSVHDELIAEALRETPGLADRIDATYIMGGAVRVDGNVGVHMMIPKSLIGDARRR